MLMKCVDTFIIHNKIFRNKEIKVKKIKRKEDVI